jgi:serine/threonine-protein kinase RsbW
MSCAEINLMGGYSAYTGLRDFIDTFSSGMFFSSRFTEGLHLTLKEAFVNAVKHGNQEKAELPVGCSLSVDGTCLQASVRDCGELFDPSALPDPAEAGHLMKLSGRGVRIMRSIADVSIISHAEGQGKSLLLNYVIELQSSRTAVL